MTPYDFIATWGPRGSRDAENERQGAQAYFIDLCELLGVPKPGSEAGYVFEMRNEPIGQERGFADVYFKSRFAWENKAPKKNLDEALRQLLRYSHSLENPPLLIVCDRHTIRIHTQFNGHPSEKHIIPIEELKDPAKQELLRRVWRDPESFRPKETNRDITEKAAKKFATLADGLRKRGPQESPAKEQYAEQIAHFLTQTLFCFFAEDVGLLPGRMFERLVSNRHIRSDELTAALENLFNTMRDGGIFGTDVLPWFNGGLFKRVKVPKLEITDITELREAAALNWSAIDVSIFGTLFERGLDPAKRSQLGAHYTDPATIERIIGPVVRRPLLQNWERSAQEIRRLMAKSTKTAAAAYKLPGKPLIKATAGDKPYQTAHKLFKDFLQSLADFKILDPACGSGNFLFLGLKALKDLEHQVITEAETMGLDRPVDLVTGPANMLGIELNEYAAELARVTVWIGELQWRMEHGYPFKDNPVLEPLDFIEHRDALLAWEDGADGKKAVETEWPKVSVVIGNPPFLGGSKKRGELGDEYFEALKTVFKDRVPGFGDLVCYWFAKALKAIETQGLGAAGFVATNSIRGGANRQVLDAIVEKSRIFEAWSDEDWVNDGAAVRVSLICFGHSADAVLNGLAVERIHADLTPGQIGGSADLTTAQNLAESGAACFMGASKKAPFDIEGAMARDWLQKPNPHGKSNALVLRPVCNGIDLTRRWGDRWIVDFGTSMNEADAMLFEAPYAYVAGAVKPLRAKNNREAYRIFWWRHAEARPGMRASLAKIPRFIITAAVAKHRTFAWMSSAVLPDQATLATVRADDTTFGILHSRFHELWSLRMCTWLGVGNDPRYTPTTCFETFPFPAGLTPRDTAHQRTETLEGGAQIPAGLEGQFSEKNRPLPVIEAAQSAIKSVVNNAPRMHLPVPQPQPAPLREAAARIAQAAHRLNAHREAWLNPPEWTQRLPEVTPLGMDHSPYPDRILPRNDLSERDMKELVKRTLTNLYNQKATGQVQWLQAAHEQLDAAVAAAYGWPDYTPAMPDEEILKRLLALNLARAQR
jgi:hypothetical protein